MDINVPVADRHYTLMDIVAKDTTILKYYTGTADSGLLYYAEKRRLDSIVIGDKLKLTPIATQAKISLNQISIPSVPPITTSVALSDLGLTPVSGFPMPALNFTIAKNLDPITSFNAAVFASGTINVTVTNNLGNLSMTVQKVRILNADNNQELLAAGPLTLPARTSQTLVIDLAGKMLVSRMKVELTVSTPANPSATLISSDNIGIRCEVITPVPQRVNAVIPQQNPVAYGGAFKLDDSSYIKEIKIDTGSLSFTIRNYFEVGLNASFTVNNLIKPDLTPYSTTIHLDKRGTSGATQIININNLKDWAITSTSALTNELQFNVNVSVLGSAPDAVTIDLNDSVKVDVNMSQLTLKSIEGKIKQTSLEFKQIAIPVKLGSLEGFSAESIHFKDFVIALKAGLSTSAKFTFEGTITGKNAQRTAQIHIPSTTIGGGIIATISINNTELENFINSFINAFPDSILIDYKATINSNAKPSDPTIKISSTDYVFGDVDIEAPTNVGIVNGTFQDTSEVTIQSQNQQQLDNINQASIILRVENGLPVGVDYFGFLLGEANDTLLFLPPKNRGNQPSFAIRPANVNSATGDVSSAVIDSITVNLIGADVRQFLKSKKLVSRFKINTSLIGGSPVRFKTSNYIKVFGAGYLNYHVKP